MENSIKRRFKFIGFTSALVFLFSILFKYLTYKITFLAALFIGVIVWLIFLCAIFVSLALLFKYKQIGILAFLPLLVVVSTYFLVLFVPTTDFGISEEYKVNLNEVEASFIKNQRSFELLSVLIKEDAKLSGARYCYEMSADENRNNIDEVHYQKYMTLFEKTNSTKVSYCLEEPGWLSFLVFSSGFVFGGCSTTIDRYNNARIPEADHGPGSTKEIIELGDGWFLEHYCN